MQSWPSTKLGANHEQAQSPQPAPSRRALADFVAEVEPRRGGVHRDDRAPGHDQLEELQEYRAVANPG
ncbi:hypothetical protein D3C76_934130 [compost metagenome]